MTTNDTKDWSELLDVALFGANRINLRQRMDRATNAPLCGSLTEPLIAEGVKR
jgi:hypothetical protein